MGTLAVKPGLNLMIEYLDVCNAASEAHRHSVLYKPIMAAYDSFFVNRQVGIDIYGGDSDEIETTCNDSPCRRAVRGGPYRRCSSVFSFEARTPLHGGRCGTPR